MSNKVVRAYPHSIKVTNAGKIVMLTDYFYRSTTSIKWFLNKFENTLVTGKTVSAYNRSLKQANYPELYALTDLTHAQYQSAYAQAFEMYVSFTAKLTRLVRIEIAKSNYDSDVKHELYTLNLKQLWFTNHVLKRIVLDLIASGVTSCPQFDNANVVKLNSNIAKVEVAKNGTSFRYWLKLSLPKQNGKRIKPIYVPLNDNKHFLNKVKIADKVLDSVQLNMNSNTATVYAQTTKASKRSNGDIIGLDWGLVNMLTTSEGNQLGQNFYTNLTDLDEILLACVQGLQRRGIKPTHSKRYRLLTKRIRGYIKAEVNRILNRIVDKNVREVIVEDLDFRDSRLSKRLNRIIRNAGRNTIKNKLKDLGETQGIATTTVRAEYTSQECSKCGYVSKKNRPTQAKFKCLHCGYRLNADTNASRVILNRRSVKLLTDVKTPNSNYRRKETLDYLNKRFTERYTYSISQATSTHSKNVLYATPN
ncbi:MAG: transposase [Micrococcaceae bacterium]